MAGGRAGAAARQGRQAGCPAAGPPGPPQGGAKVQEAFYIFQELGDKFTWTVRLHNGLAACQMRMGRWEDAESELLQASRRCRAALSRDEMVLQHVPER